MGSLSKSGVRPLALIQVVEKESGLLGALVFRRCYWVRRHLTDLAPFNGVSALSELSLCTFCYFLCATIHVTLADKDIISAGTSFQLTDNLYFLRPWL